MSIKYNCKKGNNNNYRIKEPVAYLGKLNGEFKDPFSEA